ncbi:MAG: homoserine dehydrogenase, partial [Chrysiogenetes bacterium]|nr:homoserine dehydrogenase [Chrysiogenetes bacterium]
MGKEIGIGIIGLGTVGASVAEILATRADLLERRAGARLRVTCVCDRGVSQRGEALPAHVPAGVKVAASPAELACDESVDIVIELIGGLDAAREAILAAIEAGKPVITANKHLLAVQGDEIFEKAEAKGVSVGFEAAVAGGIPILNAIRAGIGGDEI